MSMTDAERIAALISGQESLKQQTVRIRAAALNGRPERPGIDTEDIVRELVAELAQARAERDALRAERDALRAERDALRAENDLLHDPVSPSNLRDLGAHLARVLDEDRWPAAERLLNAALSERHALLDERDALRALLADARAVIAPPSVRFEAGYPLPAHLRMTAERAQLIGRIDAAIDAARAEEQRR